MGGRKTKCRTEIEKERKGHKKARKKSTEGWKRKRTNEGKGQRGGNS